MQTKNCTICGKKFKKRPSCSWKEWDTQAKFCSRECYWEARKGGKGKYKAYWKGKNLPEDIKKQISKTCRL